MMYMFLANFLWGGVIKKIAYSPSIAVDKLTLSEKDFIIPKINDIDYVSVREEQGVKLLNDCGVNNVNLVADPTLLLSVSDYSNLISGDRVHNNKKRYALIYLLGDNKWYFDFIKRFMEFFSDYELIIVPKTLHAYRKINLFDASYPEDGPLEFLNLIQYCDCVIIDSYHGICLSLKFHKVFFALQRFKNGVSGAENSRLYSLLSLVNLPNRIYANCDNINFYDVIDLQKVNLMINKLVLKSKYFLDLALEY